MARIHGVFYITAGIIVSIASFYINKSQGKKSFLLFFYVGILMIVFGLIKVILLRKKGEKHPKVTKKPAFSRYCTYCGNMAQAFDNFCSKCGNRLFHRR